MPSRTKKVVAPAGRGAAALLDGLTLDTSDLEAAGLERLSDFVGASPCVVSEATNEVRCDVVVAFSGCLHRYQKCVRAPYAALVLAEGEERKQMLARPIVEFVRKKRIQHYVDHHGAAT